MLTDEERQTFKDWTLGYRPPGAIMYMDLPRTATGPYREVIKSYQFSVDGQSFRAGERVDVDGRFLADRVQWATEFRWEIIAFLTNISNGIQTIELYGGSPKWAHTFYVCPEAIVKVVARR